jgi:hypothetical protein
VSGGGDLNRRAGQAAGPKDEIVKICINAALTFVPFNGKIFKRATISGKTLQR